MSPNLFLLLLFLPQILVSTSSIPAIFDSSYFLIGPIENNIGKTIILNPQTSQTYTIQFSSTLSYLPTHPVVSLNQISVLMTNLKSSIGIHYIPASISVTGFSVTFNSSLANTQYSVNYLIVDPSWSGIKVYQLQLYYQDWYDHNFDVAEDTYGLWEMNYFLPAANVTHIVVAEIRVELGSGGGAEISGQLLHNSVVNFWITGDMIKFGANVFLLEINLAAQIGFTFASLSYSHNEIHQQSGKVNRNYLFFNYWSTLQFQSNRVLTTGISISSSEIGFTNSFMGNELNVLWNQFVFEFRICGVGVQKYYLREERRCYEECPSRYYEDETKEECVRCGERCKECLMGGRCVECVQGFQVDSMNGECVSLDQLQPYPQPQQQPEPTPDDDEDNEEPQPNPSPSLCQTHLTRGPLPLCPNSTSMLPLCLFSSFSLSTKRCQPSLSLIQSISLISTFRSLPSAGTTIAALSTLIYFIDDISYYSYHKRNYSQSINSFLMIWAKHLGTRFMPSVVKDIYLRMGLIYAEERPGVVGNQKEGLYDREFGEPIPKKFQNIDGNVYFIEQMQQFFLFYSLVNLLLFAICYILDKISNWKTTEPQNRIQLFRKYRYFTLLPYHLLAMNIQYISFRASSQFLQSVPGPYIYLYLNIVFSVVFIFIVMVYCLIVTDMLGIFSEVKEEQYIVVNLYDELSKKWIVGNNILYFMQGVVHGALGGYGMLQSILILGILITRTFLFIYVHKGRYLKSWGRKNFNLNRKHLRYLLESVCLVLLVVFQLFLLFQYVLAEGGEEGMLSLQNEIILGKCETYALWVVIIIKTLCGLIFLVVENVVWIVMCCKNKIEKSEQQSKRQFEESKIKVKNNRKNSNRLETNQGFVDSVRRNQIVEDYVRIRKSEVKPIMSINKASSLQNKSSNQNNKARKQSQYLHVGFNLNQKQQKGRASKK